jgi:hypothetical protein
MPFWAGYLTFCSLNGEHAPHSGYGLLRALKTIFKQKEVGIQS